MFLQLHHPASQHAHPVFATQHAMPAACVQLVAALEKVLMVTGEVEPSTAAELPPPPLLSTLGGINDNPPQVYHSTNTHHAGTAAASNAGRH